MNTPRLKSDAPGPPKLWPVGLAVTLLFLTAVLLKLSIIAQEELMLLFALGVIVPLATSLVPGLDRNQHDTSVALLTLLGLVVYFVITPSDDRSGWLHLVLGIAAAGVLMRRWWGCVSLRPAAFSLAVSLAFFVAAPFDVVPVRQPLLVALSAVWCLFGFGLQAAHVLSDSLKSTRSLAALPLSLGVWSLGAASGRDSVTALGSAGLALSLWHLAYLTSRLESRDLLAETCRRLFIICLAGSGLVCASGLFSAQPELPPFAWGGFTVTVACFGLMSVLFESPTRVTTEGSRSGLAQVALVTAGSVGRFS